MGRQRRWLRLPEDVRREVIRMAARGAGYHEIMTSLDVHMGVVGRVVGPLGGVYRRELWDPPSPHRLNVEDRMAIWQGLQRGTSYRAIGAALPRPRHKSTICREVNANGGRDAYRPIAGEKRACALRVRAKPSKLAATPALLAIVEDKLSAWWSPQQIAAHLRQEFGDDQAMTVSHETIYKSLYVQGRGELRRELTACLRTGRAARRPRKTGPSLRGKIPGMVMIAERPAEVADRAVPGHWEGDLIIGVNQGSAVGTLVERTSPLRAAVAPGW